MLTVQDILHDLDHLLKFPDIKDLKDEIEIIYSRYERSLESLIAEGDDDGKPN